MVVNYRYNFNEDNNDVFLSYTLRKIKKNFLKLPIELERSAQSSLAALDVAYQHRYIKLEVRLNELALPLLEGLEQALMEEIPDYSTIVVLENQCIKLLISFDKKSKIKNYNE